MSEAGNQQEFNDQLSADGHEFIEYLRNLWLGIQGTEDPLFPIVYSGETMTTDLDSLPGDVERFVARHRYAAAAVGWVLLLQLAEETDTSVDSLLERTERRFVETFADTDG